MTKSRNYTGSPQGGPVARPVPATATVSLKFAFDFEDDCPPVAVESLSFLRVEAGYRLLVPPLFIKDLSVDDVIQAELDQDHLVKGWRHVQRSGRTTIWLLRLHQSDPINPALAELRALGCKSEGLDAAGCYAVDVPSTVPMGRVNEVLESLNRDDVAVSFPSLRHPV